MRQTDVSRLNLNARIAARVRHTPAELLQKPRFQFVAHSKLISLSGTRYVLSAITAKCLQQKQSGDVGVEPLIWSAKKLN